jgi:hypothetical protein
VIRDGGDPGKPALAPPSRPRRLPEAGSGRTWYRLCAPSVRRTHGPRLGRLWLPVAAGLPNPGWRPCVLGPQPVPGQYGCGNARLLPRAQARRSGPSVSSPQGRVQGPLRQGTPATSAGQRLRPWRGRRSLRSPDGGSGAEDPAGSQAQGRWRGRKTDLVCGRRPLAPQSLLCSTGERASRGVFSARVDRCPTIRRPLRVAEASCRNRNSDIAVADARNRP